MMPHLLRCQGFAVADYSFTLDALDPQHPRLLQHQGEAKDVLLFPSYQRIAIVTRIDALESKAVRLKHTSASASDGALIGEGYEKRICLDMSEPEHFRAVDISSDIRGKLAVAMSE